MAHELKAKHIQTETLENKANDRLLLRSILSYIEDHSDSFEDEDVVSKRFVEERLASIGEEKYIGSIASIENVDDDIPEPEEDMLIVTRDTLSVYWYDGSSWKMVGGSIETPATIKTKYESNANTNAFTDAEKSKLAGIANGATKNSDTDELAEGTINKYFTEARAAAAKIAGYIKAETPIPLEEDDSILQALGKLERGLDDRLSIRGENFIATRPTSDALNNAIELQNIIDELGTLTPNGEPLSDNNRAYVLVFPGEYEVSELYLSQPYIDVIGFGSKDGIVIHGNIETGFLNQNHRIENITIKGAIILPSNNDLCVYRNLTVDSFWGLATGNFENIEHSGVDEYLFEGIDRGRLKNLYTPKNLGGDLTVNFEGIIEDCRVEGQTEPMGISGVITRSYFKGSNGYSFIELHDGAEISYTTIINESDDGTGEEWAVTNAAPNNDKHVKIHHCHFEAKDGALNPKVINTITLGHNTWDAEGSGDGIEDIIAGTNILIDKTDPKNPIINSTATGGLTPEQEQKLENAPLDTISELGNKVDKEAGKGLFAESDQEKVDAIDIDGDGTRFLTDDGTYKSELNPRTYIEESASGSVSIDLADKDVIHVEMSGNITSFNVTNPVVGKTYKIYMIQDSVGNRTLTGLDTKFKTENDIPILLSTDQNAVDLLQMDVFSSTDIKIFPVYNI